MAEFLYTRENKRLTLRPFLHKINIFHIYCVVKAQNVSAFSTAHAEAQALNLIHFRPLSGNEKLLGHSQAASSSKGYIESHFLH